VRHESAGRLVFSPQPPYAVLRTDTVSFEDLLRVKRLARYLEIYRNSGEHARGLALLFSRGVSAFGELLAFSDWIYARLARTNELALVKSHELLFSYLVDERNVSPQEAAAAIVEDFYGRVPRAERLPFLEAWVDLPELQRRQRANRAAAHARVPTVAPDAGARDVRHPR
jgi:hypothetical protein